MRAAVLASKAVHRLYAPVRSIHHMRSMHHTTCTVRPPLSSFAILAHLLPSSCWMATITASSKSEKGLWFSCGLRWFIHLRGQRVHGVCASRGLLHTAGCWLIMPGCEDGHPGAFRVRNTLCFARKAPRTRSFKPSGFAGRLSQPRPQHKHQQNPHRRRRDLGGRVSEHPSSLAWACTRSEAQGFVRDSQRQKM